MYSRIVLALLLLCAQIAFAAPAIDVTVDESGNKTTGQSEILFDPQASLTVNEAAAKYALGEFTALDTAGSTGLQPGAVWSHFQLHNTSGQALTLDIEYVDHQLIELDAFQAPTSNGGNYTQVASLSLLAPFESRPVAHNRFVFQVTLAPDERREFLVKFSSHQAGFVFPSMRIWAPEKLRQNNNAETAMVMFLFGGIFLMSVVSFVAALATRDRTFFSYSVYALSKIVGWFTILGYTHQFIVKQHYHWSYMTITGAIGIIFGIIFSRIYLQTRQHTPRLDYVLLFMMANAVFMLVCTIFDLNTLAISSITLALLLYPAICIAGIVRFRQGSRDAAVFAVAWSLLVLGMVGQALRDLGLVGHSEFTYYWPAFASFVEMIGILTAMGLKVRRLRVQKDKAESRYMAQLESSKVELEMLVSQRTAELERAKEAAEFEARTDPLTGAHNRRSFLVEAQRCLSLAHRKGQPLSLLMFDIDHFKAINDSFGHSMGDEALRQFSSTVAGSLRDMDVWGRLGGEEFALLLYEDSQGSLLTANRLLETIRSISIPSDAGDLRFTASIGVASLAADEDIETLLNRADNALYQAKNQGRDCVVQDQALATQA
ncbi:GGDEF domain-containing protein [Mangrovimicrobium sediminis]|uniref:diguanylate cyclase n=1 Tax=Mangrovimicrobium sediminis TaxID=2562682 RepID=A0A4Z0LVJ3_9GAMM|nr:diguanylate cyclase [Haliea sp. SAOS-164]TGD71342.1 GGDEF domain-containing protein [Haliea sp. SAOS-164]